LTNLQEFKEVARTILIDGTVTRSTSNWLRGSLLRRIPAAGQLVQKPVALAPGLVDPLGAERKAEPLLGQWRWMNGVVDKPRPVVVPKVMSRIRGVHPNCYYCCPTHDT
jgi:hypothetical protein